MGARDDFRIAHISIQRTHVHLLVEADDADALSRGVRAFEISFARRINRACGGRKGRVFPDRYHAEQMLPRGYEVLPVRRLRTWLLRVGWRKAGLIAFGERPGPRA